MANASGPVGLVPGFSDMSQADKAPDPIQATIIQVRGSVHGSKGRGYLNYLPLGGGTPGQAYNLGQIQERPNTPVWVYFFRSEPVIMYLDKTRMEPNGDRGYRSPLISQHAPDHRWGSGDPAYIDTRQILELMVKPGGGLTVDVLPGYYSYGGDELYFRGKKGFDISASAPPSGTKRGVGLYLDSDRAVKSVNGPLVARTAVLPEPDWPGGAFKLALVVLTEDSTFVDFEYIKQRKRLWAGGGSGWPFSNVVTATSQAELEAAIADATVDTLVLLDNDIQLTNDVDISKTITIAGFGPGVTLTGPGDPGGRVFTVTGGGTVTLINLGLAALDSDVVFALNANVRAIGCKFILLGPITGAIAGLAVQSNAARSADITTEVIDCDFVNDDLGDSDGYGLWVSNTDTGVLDAHTAYVYHSRFGVVSQDIVADEMTLKLYNPVLPIGVSLQNAATQSGSWLDGDGNRLPLATESIAGVIEVATPAEVDTGTDTSRAVTPATLTNRLVLRVLNTSGATANAGEVGYLNEAGEYKTTTTASDVRLWCVVVTGGADSSDIYVARSGRWPVAYTGTDPAAEHYLVTSTSAGDAQRQTYVSPEIFAVCMSAGSGGTVDALLLCNRVPLTASPTEDVIRISSHSGTDFTGTIAAKSGANVEYTTTGGTFEDSIKPASSGELGKIVLHNTTRGTSALIDSVNLTNTATPASGTITLTATAPAGWQVGDAITTRSQTNTTTITGGSYFIDIDLSSADNTLIPPLAVVIKGSMLYQDSTATVSSARSCLRHPFEADAASKRDGLTLLAGNSLSHRRSIDIPLIQRKFCINCASLGSGTATFIIRLSEVVVAAP